MPILPVTAGDSNWTKWQTQTLAEGEVTHREDPNPKVEHKVRTQEEPEASEVCSHNKQGFPVHVLITII